MSIDLSLMSKYFWSTTSIDIMPYGHRTTIMSWWLVALYKEKK